ncbi:MAG TPA: hypothetical protein VHO84_10085, partial [Syntrophorhabdaceae bacterium]|nr:hypothetical protein [Syntrophorhabdaceae bacterium]
KIKKFADRVTLKSNPKFGENQLSIVEVKARGQIFREELSNFTTRVPDPELVAKFRHNAARVLTQEKIDKAVNIFLTLEETPKVSDLISALTL